MSSCSMSSCSPIEKKKLLEGALCARCSRVFRMVSSWFACLSACGLITDCLCAVRKSTAAGTWPNENARSSEAEGVDVDDVMFAMRRDRSCSLVCEPPCGIGSRLGCSCQHIPVVAFLREICLQSNLDSGDVVVGAAGFRLKSERPY